MKKISTTIVTVVSLVAVASANAATAVDTTAITGAFSAADIVTGVMAIAGTLAVVYVSIKAARTVLGMLRGS
jgi:hypothetical protein